MKPCSTEGCDGLVSERSTRDTCHNCRAGVARWMKRRPAQVLERRRKLTLYTARVNDVLDSKGLTGKISSFADAAKTRNARRR